MAATVIGRPRIEFEFRARSFRAHGQDEKRCDLIVCWENNWPSSSVKVLAAKDEIATLDGAARK